MTTEDHSSRSPPLLDRSHALLSDFDGTLAALAPHPDAVVVCSGLAGWLYQLEQHLGGAVALVTGRRLAAVDALLDPLRCMGAGAHGAELRLAIAGKSKPVIAPLPLTVVAAVQAAITPLPGVWLENKTYALAVHYRDNPRVEALCRAAVRQAVAGDATLEVLHGHAVVELRQRGVGKGRAIEQLLQQAAFQGRVPVYVGDDLADEEGFAAVQALGGLGIKVGIGRTEAKAWLADVPQVHRWLCASLMHLRSSR